MTPTDAELMAWQDEAFSKARRVLRLKKFLDPGFVRLLIPKDAPVWTAKADLVPDKIPDDDPRLRNLREHFRVLELPFAFNDIEHEVASFATYVLTDDGRAKLKEDIEVARKAGSVFGVSSDGQLRALLAVYLERSGIEMKTVFAHYMRDIIQTFGAVAYVKVDEAYTLEGSFEPDTPDEDMKKWRKQYPKSLANESAATECLMSMLGSRTFERHMILPFERTERNKGRIKSFGEMRGAKTGSEPNLRFEGQFSASFMYGPIEDDAAPAKVHTQTPNPSNLQTSEPSNV